MFDNILQSLLSLLLWPVKLLYNQSIMARWFPWNDEKTERWMRSTAEHGEQQQEQESSAPAAASGGSASAQADNASTMPHLGWHKQFGKALDVGLRFHYPDKAAERNFRADRFLIFIRLRGNKGKEVYDRLLSSAAVLHSKMDEIEEFVLRTGGEQVRPAVKLVRSGVYIAESILWPLMSAGHTMTTVALGTLQFVARPFIGKSLDPAAELEQNMPTHKVVNQKSLWIPTQGTLHLLTLKPRAGESVVAAEAASSSIPNDDGTVYELSFDFPPNKVRGAQDLINPNLTLEQKAQKAVRLIVESVVTVPLAAPFAGRIAESILRDMMGGSGKVSGSNKSAAASQQGVVQQ